MIIRGTYRNDCPATFWVVGTMDRPKIGSIYTTRLDALKCSTAEALSIVERFSANYSLEILPDPENTR